MKKRLNWEALKYKCCPQCNKQLVAKHMLVCEHCTFSISFEKYTALTGFKKRNGGKSFHVDGFRNHREAGFTIMDSAGNLIKREVLDESMQRQTNNDAEVKGIIYCILHLCEAGDEILSDSDCAIIWVKSGRSKARPDLFSILQQGRTVMLQKKLSLQWVSRWHNKAGLYNDEYAS